MPHSVAMTTGVHEDLVRQLAREDGQEDLCFALCRTSTGATRTTTLLTDLLLPGPDERHVHGNVAFTGDYFLRCAGAAADAELGLAFLHSHPGGHGWQGMSPDDIAAEHGHAPRTLALTDKPLVGLTLATGDGAWSARTWTRNPDRSYQREDCATVRVVGGRLQITRDPTAASATAIPATLSRTVSVWGEECQRALAALRIGIVGLGSVGSMVAEALARTGIRHLVLIDFDSVKTHNLDRTLHATRRGVRAARSKVELLARALRRSATHPDFRATPLELSVTEPAGWAAALDCDVVFSCVDRPWPRHALNLAAFAHLVPVIDGGIRARASKHGRMLSADWKTQTCAPGRCCMQCSGQYAASDVTLEREGLLDDPTYVEGLPPHHYLRTRQNVFSFSMNLASLEVLQLISMVIAPSGVYDLDVQNHHASTGELDIDSRDCERSCPYQHELTALGDTAPTLIGEHAAAAEERARRMQRRRSVQARWCRAVDDLASRLTL
jgi:molybdopterin-synthase adenylyltransferase